MFWSAGCSFFRAEGFSCNLGVLYGGLGIRKLQFLIPKIFSCKIFYRFLVLKTLDPEVDPVAIRKNAGSALNQCGSETLHFIMWSTNNEGISVTGVRGEPSHAAHLRSRNIQVMDAFYFLVHRTGDRGKSGATSHRFRGCICSDCAACFPLSHNVMIGRRSYF